MQPLTYRSPTDDARVARTLNRIRQREAGFWLRSAAMLAIGLPLSLFGPFVVALFVYGILLRFHLGVWCDVAFFVLLVIMIPVFYIIEWRTRGDFLVNEMRAQGTTASDILTTGSRGEWEIRRRAAAVAGLIEIFLFAPRLTLDGVASMRKRIKLSDASMRRAAQIVSALQAQSGAIEGRDLREPAESPLEFYNVLRYLRLHDWIDISADGRRVWLLSAARLRLSK
ncbi:MAG TPA: hypothetical protein VGQ99_11720 [Tepidisphaeraceae bacterium]|jgi:hypothetical protein|nr:hypothetical protein [Tepidisphaeraceae bacterium]